MNKISEPHRLEIMGIMQDSEHKASVVKAVCPHAQYCGNAMNDYYGNGTPHKFLCRKNLLAHRRTDGLIMMAPFTDADLSNAFKRYCFWAYGETCETAGSFGAEFPITEDSHGCV